LAIVSTADILEIKQDLQVGQVMFRGIIDFVVGLRGCIDAEINEV